MIRRSTSATTWERSMSATRSSRASIRHNFHIFINCEAGHIWLSGRKSPANGSVQGVVESIGWQGISQCKNQAWCDRPTRNRKILCHNLSPVQVGFLPFSSKFIIFVATSTTGTCLFSRSPRSYHVGIPIGWQTFKGISELWIKCQNNQARSTKKKKCT